MIRQRRMLLTMWMGTADAVTIRDRSVGWNGNWRSQIVTSKRATVLDMDRRLRSQFVTSNISKD
jgi:hypothetical protein